MRARSFLRKHKTCLKKDCIDIGPTKYLVGFNVPTEKAIKRGLKPTRKRQFLAFNTKKEAAEYAERLSKAGATSVKIVPAAKVK